MRSLSFRCTYVVYCALFLIPWLAAGAQTVTVAPTSLSFASVMAGSSSAKAVTLTNGQSTAITLSTPTLTGSGFSIISGGSCNVTLAPAHACTYHISFNPTAAGNYNATLSINDTGANSPQQVALTGTGVVPVTLTFPSTNFGNQTLTTTSGLHTATLTNNQTVALNSIKASISGEFAIASGGTCGTTLAAHSKCTILVTFTPLGLGTRTGVLTTTDTGSNSPQSVTITGTGALAGVHALTIAPTTPQVTQGQNQQFAATATTGNGGTITLTSLVTWTSSSTPVATITSGGLAHAVAVGSTSISASISAMKASTLMTVAPVSTSNNPCSSGPCVLTYHNDNNRDGVFSNEMQLTPANVVKPGFGGKGKISDLNGQIYAQPLYLSGMFGMSQTGNVLYLATQKNYVYAYDADALTQLWGGSYIPATEVPLSTGTTGTDFTCTNIQPNVGITSTPALDISTKYNANPVLYFVTRSETTGSTRTYHQRLHAVDAVTGVEVFGSPVEITTPTGSAETFDPLYENQRSGLVLTHDANGNPQVYISWASHCDMQPFRGWIMKYMVTNGVLGSAPSGYLVTTQNAGEEGGIWMSGSAPAVDNPVNGNLYVATGNGSYDGVVNWGQSVLKLDANLNVIDWYTPNEWPCLNEIEGNPNCTSDRDLGSGGVVLFNPPGGSPEAISIGKQGEAYILYQSNLGHLDPAATDPTYAPPYTCTEGSLGSPSNIAQCFLAVQTPNQHGAGMFSTPAVWNGQMFVAGASGILASYSLDPSNPGTFLTTPLNSTYPPSYGYPGASLVVSWNGTDPNTAILWSLSTTGSNNVPPSADILRAYTPSTMMMNYQSTGGPGAVRYVMPIVVNGKVYVAGQGNTTTPGKGQVYVYGLCPCQQ